MMNIIDKIEELKNDIVQQLYGLIISSQEDKNNEKSIKNKISEFIKEINKRFIESLQGFGFKVSDSFIDYLNSEKPVIESQMYMYLEKNIDELYGKVKGKLGEYVERLSYYEDIDDDRERNNIQSELEDENEDKDRNIRKNNMLNLLEGYISQIRYRIISQLDITDERVMELASVINNELLWKKTEEFKKILDEEDNELLEQIQDKIIEFFSQVSNIKSRAKEENGPKDAFRESIDARGCVDEQKAIEDIERKNQEGKTNQKQALSIQLYDG